MKVRKINFSIITSVVLSVVLILFFFSCVTIYIYRTSSTSLEREKKAFEETKFLRESQLNELKLKKKLALIIKEVTFANMLLMNVDMAESESPENEIEKVWEEQISPLVAEVDHEIDHYSDDYKKKFNKINDRLSEIKKKHQNAIEVIRNRESLSRELPEDRKYDLYNEVEGFAENYNSFLKTDTDLTDVKYSKKGAGNDEIVLLIVVIFFAVILFSVILALLVNHLRRPLLRLESFLLELRQGNLPNEIKIDQEDYKSIVYSVNYIVRKMKNIKQFAFHIGSGDFDTGAGVLFERDGDFGNSLADMQTSLKKVAEQDEQRFHINQGLANFSEILGHNTNNLEKFCEEIVINLVKFLNANQGAFFVVKDEDHFNPVLELEASYAYNKRKYHHKTIKKGQGLVGQSWLEKQRIYMTDIPKSYVSITSGLGESTPRCVLIVPLVFNEEVQGVIELASFQKLKDYELGFVEKVSESISSSLASVKVNSKTQALLIQSEELAQKMSGQEDEMRKKVDELRITQEESQRREEQHLREIRRLRKRLESYERHM